MVLHNMFGELALDETLTDGSQKTRIVDGSGVQYTRIPVDIGGAEITGSFEPTPSVLSQFNVPPAPLTANEEFVGQWEDVMSYAAIQVTINTDQASAANGALVEFSDDGVNVLRPVATTIPANFPAYFHLPKGGQYVRFRYKNGPVAQTKLELSILFSGTTPAEVVQPIGSQTTDANSATVEQSHLKSRVMSGASTGAWLPVGNDGTGRMLVSTGLAPLTDAQLRATAVPVTTGLDPLTDTQLRATPVPVTTGLAPLTDTQLRATPVPVTTGLAPLTDTQLRATPVSVATGLSPLTDTQLRATPVPTSLDDASLDAMPGQGLVPRMKNNDPAPGYTMWVDVLASSSSFIYTAEAPVGADPTTDTVWRGTRLELNANGLPLGPIRTCIGFAWDNRAGATWVA